MKKEVLLALVSFIIIWTVSFFFATYLGYGKAEGGHDPTSIWMYGRRLLLIALAVITPRLSGKNILALIGWKVSAKWLLISIAVGFAMGFGNRGGFNPSSIVALILALFHCFAYELYFRGYLYKFLEGEFKNSWTSLFLSSLATGLLYLTEGPVWGYSIVGKIGFVFLFSAVGFLFGFMYKKSQSFWVPWLTHFFGVLRYQMLF